MPNAMPIGNMPRPAGSDKRNPNAISARRENAGGASAVGGQIVMYR